MITYVPEDLSNLCRLPDICEGTVKVGLLNRVQSLVVWVSIESNHT